MSGLTLTSPHCVFRTVIHGRVLDSQVVHLQIERVLAIVSGDGESALHGVGVVYATTSITNVCDPLQSLPWSLADPVHSVATEGESRAHTGESQGPPRLHQASPRLQQLHLTLDTCKHKDIRLGNCHPTESLCHINSHAQCLILHKLPLKIATRKTQLSPNTMVSGLCPLLSRHCEHLGILGWLLSQSCRVSAGRLFMRRGALFACLPPVY